MDYRKLRFMRIGIQFLFFCIYTIILSGFFTFTSRFSFLSKLQLFPAFIQSFKLVFVSMAVVGIEIIVTLVFGRLYCSSICPLGTLQDGIGFVNRKLQTFFHCKGKKTKKMFIYPVFLRFFVTVSAVVSLFIGFSFFGGLFEPYSIFGKIISVFNQPFFGISILQIFLVNFGIFVLFIILSKNERRIFCNSLCPVGTILGIAYWAAVFKPFIDSKKCILCGKCSDICKGECIDFKKYAINPMQCVLCFNCMTVCPEGAITIVSNKEIKKIRNSATNTKNDNSNFLVNNDNNKLSVNNNKMSNSEMANIENVNVKQNTRKLFIHQLSGVFLYFLMLLYIPIRFVNNVNYSIPPGALEIAKLKMYCTQCSLCARVCPTNVIMIGNQTPYLDYDKGYCLYECTLCNQYCPTSALNPISLEEKQTIQLGKVNLLKDKCLVYRDDKHCGACAEQCPTQAVYMVPYKGILYGPETNQNICVGCGACQFVCPAQPEKAILVDVYSQHKKRDTIDIKPLSPEEEEIDSEFPF